jgi:beta-lactamase class A
MVAAAAILLALPSCALNPSRHAATPSATGRTTSPASPTPAPSPAPARRAALVPAIARYLRTRSGNVSVSVWDQGADVWYSYRPDVAHRCASVVKVSILGAVLLDSQEGGISLTAQDRSLAERMIELSDNDAATALWNLAGGPDGVASFVARAGMTATVPNAAWGYTTTTTVDQVRLLRTFALPNDVLSAASRAYGMGLLREVDDSERWGVSAGVSDDAEVALKDGWLAIPGEGWLINSIGWVSGAGRRYAIAVLSDHDPGYAQGIATIEGVSRIVWSQLAP